MALLEMNHIVKGFDGVGVLKDISLAVSEGEVLSVIGRSGSGKTTLLRCATMLENVDSGEISYLGETAVSTADGKPVYAEPEKLRQIETCFGMVFQNFNLFPHRNVLQNVTDAPILVRRVPKEKALAEGRDLLMKMGLSDKEAAYPCQLSGGQCQRVAIARALALNPKILFFDEPTSALDPELTGEVLKVIRELAAMHITMVIITHEMQFARDISDRILFMDQGLIAVQGTPEEVFGSDNARIRDFLGRYSEENSSGN